MRKVILFIAMSLDGYIADERGGVDWLEGQGNSDENIDTYSEFVKDIDTILMGWNTYHQVTTELSPTQWVYEDFTTYVITHNQCDSTEKIRFTDENPVALLKELRRQDGKDIWICGGAGLVQQLRKADMIDRYDISVIPTILGKGIRLFGEIEKEQKLALMKTQSYNGIVELIYERRPVPLRNMIRKFKEADVGQVMRIWLQGNVEAHPFVPENYWMSNYEMVREQMCRAEVYVAEEDGVVQGFIGLAEQYIAGIFVESQYRSAGIGKQLLEYAKEIHNALTLSVYQQNERAVAFYMREGFSVSGQGMDEETGSMEYTMSWTA